MSMFILNAAKYSISFTLCPLIAYLLYFVFKTNIYEGPFVVMMSVWQAIEIPKTYYVAVLLEAVILCN